MGKNPKYAELKIGDVFGPYTIVGQKKGGRWPVQCQCGFRLTRQSNHLLTEHGLICSHVRKHELGKMFGSRMVIGYGKRSGSLKTLCMDCNTESVINPDIISVCRNCSPVEVYCWEDKGVVYGLTCPFTGSVRYVGGTALPLNERLWAHWSTRNSRNKGLHLWMRELEKHGARPGIITLEKVNGEHLATREVFWIRKLSKEYKLLQSNGAGGFLKCP